MWPGWVTSAATITTFLFGGGDATLIAICALFAIGIALSASTVVYQTIEKLEFLKVGMVLVFLVVALAAAVSATAYSDVSQVATSFGTFPGELSAAVLLGALAYAGAGGTNNLVLSNWIRDKGYAMGTYAPRTISPITGNEEAAPSGRGYVFRPDEAGMERWREWWRKANVEQFVSFFVIGAVTIGVFSLVAYSTVFENPAVQEDDFDFIRIEGTVLKDTVGAWFGTLFWLIGAISLFGTAILLAGFDQPLTLVVLAAALSGGVMFIYSILLIAINRRFMPQPLKIRGVRLVFLAWAVLLFGVMSVIVVADEAGL